jgi:hypothetical protein
MKPDLAKRRDSSSCSFSAISGMPSLFTSGKTAALIGARRGWKRMISGDGRDGSLV